MGARCSEFTARGWPRRAPLRQEVVQRGLADLRPHQQQGWVLHLDL
jgi:hypothetical protein